MTYCTAQTRGLKVAAVHKNRLAMCRSERQNGEGHRRQKPPTEKKNPRHDAVRRCVGERHNETRSFAATRVVPQQRHKRTRSLSDPPTNQPNQKQAPLEEDRQSVPR